jgi:hypothetical protein
MIRDIDSASLLHQCTNKGEEYCWMAFSVSFVYYIKTGNHLLLINWHTTTTVTEYFHLLHDIDIICRSQLSSVGRKNMSKFYALTSIH